MSLVQEIEEYISKNPLTVLCVVVFVLFLSLCCCCGVGLLAYAYAARQHATGNEAPHKRTAKPKPKHAPPSKEVAEPPRPPSPPLRPRSRLEPDEPLKPKKAKPVSLGSLAGESPFGLGPGMGMGMGSMAGGSLMGGGMGMGMDMMSSMSGFGGGMGGGLGSMAGSDFSQALLSQLGGAQQKKSKSVCIAVGVGKPNVGSDVNCVDTMEADLKTIKAAMQDLDYETWTLTETRENGDYHPTVDNFTFLTEQIIDDDIALDGVLLYLCCKGRLSPDNSQPEILLKQADGAATEQAVWTPLKDMIQPVLCFRAPVWFVFDIELLDGTTGRAFFRQTKSLLYGQFSTPLLLCTSRPCLYEPASKNTVFPRLWKTVVAHTCYSNVEPTLPQLHRHLAAEFRNRNVPNADDNLLLYANELGGVGIQTKSLTRVRASPFLPQLPDNVIRRSEQTQLEAAIFNSSVSTSSTDGEDKNNIGRPFIIIQGAKAVGKTLLALHTAWESSVLSKFTDGVFYLPLRGDLPTIRYIQNLAWCALNYDGTFQTTNEAGEILSMHLGNSLLILDDVKSAEQVISFHSVISAKGLAKIIVIPAEGTTVDFSCLKDYMETEICLGDLTERDRKLVLAVASLPSGGLGHGCRSEEVENQLINRLPPSAITISSNIKQIASLSLIGTFVGRTKHKDNPFDWDFALKKLQAAGSDDEMLTVLSNLVVPYVSPMLQSCIKSLCILPINMPLSVDAINTVLQANCKNLTQARACRIVARLNRLGLLQAVFSLTGWGGYISAPIHCGLTAMLNSQDVQQMHVALSNQYLKSVVATDKPLPKKMEDRNWFYVGNDHYFYKYIQNSWKLAGLEDGVYMLTQYVWIYVSTLYIDVYELLDTLDLYLQDKSTEPNNKLLGVYNILQTSKPVLTRIRWELPTQVYGRSVNIVEEKMDPVLWAMRQHLEKYATPVPLGSYERDDKELWLKPLGKCCGLSQFLPNNEVVDTRRKQGGPVTACLFLPDGNLATACPTDGKILVWSTSTGDILHELEHEGVDTLIITGEERTLASGAREKRTIRVWKSVANKESELVQVLPRPAPKKGKKESKIKSTAESSTEGGDSNEKTDDSSNDEKEEEEEEEDKNYLVSTLYRTGYIIGKDDEYLRDALLVYNKKYEDEEFNPGDDRVYQGHDDMRPVLVSFTNDCEVKCSAIGEKDNKQIIAFGDVNGFVTICELVQYSYFTEIELEMHLQQAYQAPPEI